MVNKSDDKLEIARKMILDGESFEKIMEKTKLREKDLKRIREDIAEHF
ncbi:MAG: hypothetical protein K0R54_2788 [Clostridiaceae bacterium]|jgi:hypothetical protein|nr:hypothetical protein [Clostridiaceae bacterium]